ncbi:MAG: MerR family transcriptional regulator [bacterium]
MQSKDIPDKLFYRIGDVSKIVGVKSHVLRYWESEFTQIRPIKNKRGQRLYRRKDIDLLIRIKELLYTELYTIAGAKRRLGLEAKLLKEIGHIPNYIKCIEILQKQKKQIEKIQKIFINHL